MTRYSGFARPKALQAELDAAQFSLARTIAQALADPSMLRAVSAPPLAVLRRSAARMEITFLLRMFAEFESVLRDYWSTIKRTEPIMKSLLDGVAARRKVPSALQSEAHAVREYRNCVARKTELTPDIPFTQCRSRLCRFLAYLPESW